MDFRLVGSGFSVDIDVDGRPARATHAGCGRRALVEGDRVWCATCGVGSNMRHWPTFADHSERVTFLPDDVLEEALDVRRHFTPSQILEEGIARCRACPGATGAPIPPDGDPYGSPWIVGASGGASAYRLRFPLCLGGDARLCAEHLYDRLTLYAPSVVVLSAPLAAKAVGGVASEGVVRDDRWPHTEFSRQDTRGG